MAVMVNSFGGGFSGTRGEYYYREIMASSAVGSNQNLLTVEGEGRILEIIVCGNFADYSTTKATAKVTVDSGLKVLQKKIIKRQVSEEIFVPIVMSREMIVDRGDHFFYGLNLAAIPSISAAYNGEGKKPYRYFGPFYLEEFAAPNLTENLPAGQQDYSCTFYQDGLFFDESFTIECNWQAYDSSKPNKIIVYYELFD
jgi:hypothetical protein